MNNKYKRKFKEKNCAFTTKGFVPKNNKGRAYGAGADSGDGVSGWVAQ